MNDTKPSLLEQLERYPLRYKKIANAMQTKQNLLELAVESDRIKYIDEQTKNDLLISYVRQNCRLIAECASLKSELLILKRELGKADIE